ncbi:MULTISPECIES: acyl carrier protein [Mycobacterium]|uniref:Carrier domain-containing protein n=1 Tax=Mycobacterium kiyosense TaxID=2871094 RepID=A0A9P3V0V1_9MYCO|nr:MULTISPECIES: acyl carrier protein [Mycobacterium]BDB45675.1 hypothetical protein IWGMT90018_61210 [Mycobacterium kiyosense]BDE11290.1 hypothetical protein MKCMC460_01500 [Mycobacterium sp. 20KCMC460]GLB84584.1 hypothetical protein SRL2020028_38400 [Mycobacterium kiyosense]GLB91618.1 hypothetical protein SRL2020130_44350 [Mycobacterium kiyosense]GLB96896.1 hypothetical protein SRL2020226_36720 [Mycobacterium kiyosense]
MNPDQTQELADWLLSKVSRYLNVAPDTIDFDVPLADFGIDSAMSLSLCADLQRERGVQVDTTIVYDYPTINAMAEYLSGQGEP